MIILDLSHGKTLTQMAASAPHSTGMGNYRIQTYAHSQNTALEESNTENGVRQIHRLIHCTSEYMHEQAGANLETKFYA